MSETGVPKPLSEQVAILERSVEGSRARVARLVDDVNAANAEQVGLRNRAEAAETKVVESLAREEMLIDDAAEWAGQRDALWSRAKDAEQEVGVERARAERAEAETVSLQKQIEDFEAALNELVRILDGGGNDSVS